MKFYAARYWNGGWALKQRDAHGDRLLARGMSERTARKAARLFNAAEDN